MQPDTLPRRTVLAVALAAMAGGCVPSPASAAPVPDVELTRLGQEFAQAFDEWWQAHWVWRAADREAVAALAPHGLSGADSTAAFNSAYDASPAGAASAANDAALDRCDALAEAIRTIRPTSLAGLAAHAKVARFKGMTPSTLAAQRDALDLPVATILDFLDLVEGLSS